MSYADLILRPHLPRGIRLCPCGQRVTYWHAATCLACWRRIQHTRHAATLAKAAEQHQAAEQAAYRAAVQRSIHAQQADQGLPLLAHCGRWWPVTTLPVTLPCCGAVLLGARAGKPSP